MDKSRYIMVAPRPDEKKAPPPKTGTKPTPVLEKVSRRVVKRSGGRSTKRGTSAPSLPPSLEMVTAFDCVRRYTNGSASNVVITRQSLGASVGGVCSVANTTIRLICSSFRLVKVTIWPATGTSVLWDVLASSSGSEQALSRESTKNSALPTGITVDQPTVWKPKKGTYQAMWQSVIDQGTDQLFAFSGGAGCVIDVHLVGTIGGATSALPSVTTTSTVAVGAFGVMALDTSNLISNLGYTTFNW